MKKHVIPNFGAGYGTVTCFGAGYGSGFGTPYSSVQYGECCGKFEAPFGCGCGDEKGTGFSQGTGSGATRTDGGNLHEFSSEVQPAQQ